ncbi:carbohydrate kinase [Violaceomyces palustris]|uniref:Carbohydrate kinase n=1 Tax=Violaceomyces palustris TaxID=1673888 RepID=A0ACD0NLE9_9BASI|nr:carbohydrate kinase [Violaceomyces palustris]
MTTEILAGTDDQRETSPPSSPLGDEPNTTVLLVVMGTSGSGKSTLGSMLAQSFGLPFVDGDDLHPPANVEKMSKGIPLNDQDRLPWLRTIREEAMRLNGHHQPNHGSSWTTTAAEEDSKGSEPINPNLEESGSISITESGSISITNSNSKGRKACVIACSALKKSYRDLLRGQDEQHQAGGKKGEGVEGHQDQNPDGPTGGKLRKREEQEHRPSPNKLKTYHIYMDISPEILMERMKARKNHFMKEDMLRSQLQTLEVPIPKGEQGQLGEEGIIVVPVSKDSSMEAVRDKAVQLVLQMVGPLH